MNAIITLPHPLNAAMLQAEHEIDRRLIRVLYDARPHRLTVWKVMTTLGVEVNTYQRDRKIHEVNAFIGFCILRVRVAQILSRHGFDLKRDGGTIDHEIWLEPHSASS